MSCRRSDGPESKASQRKQTNVHEDIVYWFTRVNRSSRCGKRVCGMGSGKTETHRHETHTTETGWAGGGAAACDVMPDVLHRTAAPTRDGVGDAARMAAGRIP